ncbi:hypothetical protein HanIR_Chr02g0069651 [Helianthus annuus]|nr:hypothetical protein HanIR_Chr02g0069651 [Helianthus annuus]
MLYSCLSEELVLNQEYFKHSKPYLETNQQNLLHLLTNCPSLKTLKHSRTINGLRLILLTLP